MRLATYLFPLVAFTLYACDGKPAAPAAGKPAEPASSEPIRYRDSVDGLTSLVRDMQGAAGAADSARAAALGASLVLADPKAFFASTFGDDAGARLAADYAALSGQIGAVPATFARLAGEGKTEVAVQRFTEVGDVESNAYQSEALSRMRRPIALYSVRLTPPGQPHRGVHFYNFVHDGESFRFVGKLKGIKGGPPPSEALDAAAELRIRDADRFFATGKLPGEP